MPENKRKPKPSRTLTGQQQVYAQMYAPLQEFLETFSADRKAIIESLADVALQAAAKRMSLITSAAIAASSVAVPLQTILSTAAVMADLSHAYSATSDSLASSVVKMAQVHSRAFETLARSSLLVTQTLAEEYRRAQGERKRLAELENTFGSQLLLGLNDTQRSRDIASAKRAVDHVENLITAKTDVKRDLTP